MSNRDAAMFWGMAALIFPAFSPVHLLAGQIVAGVGFLFCGGVALVLYLTPGERDR